jgi:hypothetical protein
MGYMYKWPEIAHLFGCEQIDDDDDDVLLKKFDGQLSTP